MRVHVVDPSAYTPPYDHALCRALAAAGADVELFTSRFAHGAIAPAEGYERRELFYRAARLAPGRSHAGQRTRRLLKLLEHVPDMLRYRRASRGADVVHFQWLAVQHLDRYLLPPGRLAARRRGLGASRGADGAHSANAGRPLVLTAHDILPREPRLGQRRAQRRLYERFDAIVVHSRHGRDRLTRELGVDEERVHVIPHGAFAHLAEGPPAAPRLQSEQPVVLFFGLMRPYKGLDVLLRAWHGIEQAELWVVGQPRMDVSSLRATAPANVRFVTRFVGDAELGAYFRRADLVVLPYREIDQSGVLFTALAFGKPLLVSDVGGFAEVAADGAARVVPAGDVNALHRALRELLDDPGARATLAERARAAAAGKYAWDDIARQTLALYRSLLDGGARR